MTDSAQVTGEQLLGEWAPAGSARVTDEQLLAEWQPTSTGRLSAERLLAEWAPGGSARVAAAQLLVEWDVGVRANLVGVGSLSASPVLTVLAPAAVSGVGSLISQMSSTFVLRAASSDLNLGGLFNRLLAQGTETAGSITVSPPASTTSSGYAFTPADAPGLQGITGDYTVKVNVTTGNTRIFVSIVLARLNAAGTTQSSSAASAEQVANAGVLTFTFASLNLGTWQPGDRLMVQYRFRNSQNMANSAVIQTGTANAAITTPWSVPQGKAGLKGVGTLTASATAVGPTNAAGSVAAQTSVSGTADKTHSSTASYAPDGSLDWDVEVVP